MSGKQIGLPGAFERFYVSVDHRVYLVRDREYPEAVPGFGILLLGLALDKLMGPVDAYCLISKVKSNTVRAMHSSRRSPQPYRR